MADQIGHALLSFLSGASKKTGTVPYADFRRDHPWSFAQVADPADLYILAQL
jgi:hypothetical protein